MFELPPPRYSYFSQHLKSSLNLTCKAVITLLSLPVDLLKSMSFLLPVFCMAETVGSLKDPSSSESAENPNAIGGQNLLQPKKAIL